MAWSQLPSEVFDIILEDLQLRDIKNLRLSNKSTAERCLGPRFLSFASTAKTEMTEKSLWDLMARASHPTFSRAVRRLQILAISYDHGGEHVPCAFRVRRNAFPISLFRGTYTRIEKPRANYDFEWLQTQQKMRDSLSDQFIIEIIASAFNSFTALQEISLRALIMTSPDEEWWPYGVFPPVSTQWTSHVCYLALAAIADSRTTARSLDIYGKKDIITPSYLEAHVFPGVRCGVFARDLALHLAKIKQRYADIQFSFENLHLNMCTGTRSSNWPDSRWSITRSLPFTSTPPSVDGEDTMGDLSGVMELLKSMPGLRHLGLHLVQGSLDIPKDYCDIITQIADQASLTQLRSCSFAGVPMTTAALLNFLAVHPSIETLSLAKVSIPAEDDWDPIFRFMAEMVNLESLLLSQCYQGRTLVRLEERSFIEHYFGRRDAIPLSYINGEGPDIHLILYRLAYVDDRGHAHPTT